jgi:hypothetical protein
MALVRMITTAQQVIFAHEVGSNEGYKSSTTSFHKFFNQPLKFRNASNIRTIKPILSVLLVVFETFNDKIEHACSTILLMRNCILLTCACKQTRRLRELVWKSMASLKCTEEI